MEYRSLGRSGLRVSQLMLGTLGFSECNDAANGAYLDVKTARRMIDIACEAGINTIDTANLYSLGLAEEVLGQALQGRRDDVLIASKVCTPIGDGPNDSGASRYHIIRECENSLRRLQTDHIDLYQLHQWDGLTPIEESLAALDHLLQSGKVRYIGTSNYSGWQMMKTMATAREYGLAQPVSQQIYYTPEAREAEYEILPVGRDQGLGTLIWSPLGGGLLTGNLRRDNNAASGRLPDLDWPANCIRDRQRLFDIIELLVEIGAGHGVSAAQVVLAWLKDRPGVTALILGARNEEQLRDNLGCLELKLSPDEYDRIEEATRPVPLYPHWIRAMNGHERRDPADEPFLVNFRRTLGLQ